MSQPGPGPKAGDERWRSADAALELDLLRRSARDALAAPLPLSAAAQLGWTGLLTDVAAGGQGWFPVAAGAIAREAGAARSPSGWAAAALAAGALAGDEVADQRAEVLAGTLAVGFGVARTGWSGTGRWTGSGRVVSDGEPALFVFVAPDGTGAWALPADDAGVRTVPVDLDTTRTVTEVAATGADVIALDTGPVERLFATAALLRGADSVGALRATLQLVTAHLVERQAFGAPLASQQVLQHRIVDHDVLCTAAATLVDRALRDLEATSIPSAAVWAAPQYVHRRVIAALDDCIQLTGGIGFTWEFPVHHALRRAVVNETLGPDPFITTDRLAAAGGW